MNHRKLVRRTALAGKIAKRWWLHRLVNETYRGMLTTGSWRGWAGLLRNKMIWLGPDGIHEYSGKYFGGAAISDNIKYEVGVGE